MQTTNEELTKQLEELKANYDELQRERDELLLKNKSNSEFNTNRHSEEFWTNVGDKITKHETEYIKHLIQTKKITMDDVDEAGESLLHKAAGSGVYEIVQLCINLGADINGKDKSGQIAADHGSYYKDIEQLLKFAAMNANNGDRIRNTAFIIKQQKGINENILSQLSLIGEQSKEIFEKSLIEIMINIISKREAFSDCLLNLCFDIISNKNEGNNKNILRSDLWITINKTCKEIIENGNKRDWYWMKQYIIPSTIWYKDLNAKQEKEKEEKEDDDFSSDTDQDIILNDDDTDKNKDNPPEYLYYKLLELTKVQESNLKNKLKSSMETEKNKNIHLWNDLVSFDLSDDKLLNLKDISSTSITKNRSKVEMTKIRQDNIPNGITSLYTFNELTQQFTTSSSFNSHKFYDYNQYLPRLQLNAQIVDDEFHKSIQKIFNINKDSNIGIINIKNKSDEEKKYDNNTDKKGERSISYRRGPVKLMERARNKTENDYSDQIFPTTACVLDFNRCTLIFNEIDTLLYSLNLFANKISYYQSGNIIAIVRTKNGFREYIKNTQYADIKLNVLIKGVQNNIIGEVQFLMHHMLHFKTKNHSLYSIQREEEYIKNSITRILPSLLNYKKQILIASERGNTDTFRQLMVHSNKTDKDIMIFDSIFSVLYGICEKGHVKAFEYLKNTIDTNLLIEHLCFGQYGAVEIAIANGHLLMIQKICAIPAFLDIFKTNDDELFKITAILFKYCSNENLIDLMLSEMGITAKKLQELVDYTSSKYPEDHIINDAICYHDNKLNILQKLISIIGDEAFNDGIFTKIKTKYKNVDDQFSALIYLLFGKCRKTEIIDFILKRLSISDEQIIKAMDHKDKNDGCTLIGRVAEWNKLNILIKLTSIIGQKTFAHHLFVSNGENKNALECVLADNELAKMKYLMSIKDVKQKCLMDQEILWRIVYWMDQKSANKSMAKYIKDELQLNEKTLKQLQEYKCSESFDADSWEHGLILAEKYWNKRISDEAVKTILNI